MTSVIRAISLAANLGRFLWRHKRLTLALAVGLLIVAPLLTGSGFGTFFGNLRSSTSSAWASPPWWCGALYRRGTGAKQRKHETPDADHGASGPPRTIPIQ